MIVASKKTANREDLSDEDLDDEDLDDEDLTDEDSDEDDETVRNVCIFDNVCTFVCFTFQTVSSAKNRCDQQSSNGVENIPTTTNAGDKAMVYSF